MDLREEIINIVRKQVREVNRPDLFREPICAFSSAKDKRYQDLKSIIGDWHCNPEELLPGAMTVISFFVPFTKSVVEAAKIDEPVSPLWGEAYAVLNNLLGLIGNELKNFLEEENYPTINIAATHTYSKETIQSMWSHRSAAFIAGLGSFGANRLLITEKGSAGRFCTVITTAEIEPSTLIVEERCLYMKNGSCKLCIKVCPINALKIDAFDKFSCQDRTLNNAVYLKDSNMDVCGKCIAICPVAFIE